MKADKGPNVVQRLLIMNTMKPGSRSLSLFAFALALASIVQAVGFHGESDDMVAALKLFDKSAVKFKGAERKNAPFLRTLIKRYLAGEQMTQSEANLSIATLEKIGFTGAVGERNGGGSLDDFLGGGDSGAAKHVDHKSQASILPKAKFSSGSANIGHHRSMAWVAMSAGGRSRHIIEVPGSESMSPAQRARTIARRIERLQIADPLWWMKLKVGHIGNEYVVRESDAPGGFILTADKPFARLETMSPSELCRFAIRRIKSTMDDRTASRSGSEERDLVPMPTRDAAIDSRQEGDELYSSHPDQAEAKYRAAIDADPTYVAAYVRLVQLLRDEHKDSEAAEVAKKALDQKGVTEEDRKELGGS